MKVQFTYGSSAIGCVYWFLVIRFKVVRIWVTCILCSGSSLVVWYCKVSGTLTLVLSLSHLGVYLDPDGVVGDTKTNTGVPCLILFRLKTCFIY